MPDCCQTELANTVKEYFRHFLVCTPRQDWEGKIEKEGGQLGEMARIFSHHKKQMPASKFNAIDLPAGRKPNDVLVFPEKICYQDVDLTRWQKILQEHAIAGRICSNIPSTPLQEWYIFICTHGTRDRRCGEIGPEILAEFQQQIQKRQWSHIHVQAISHVGGHKYAGNVLIYPGGIWYGYVERPEVTTILEQHIKKGKLVSQLFRGKMAVRE